MFGLIEPGALLVALLSLAVLVTWERPFIEARQGLAVD